MIKSWKPKQDVSLWDNNEQTDPRNSCAVVLMRIRADIPALLSLTLQHKATSQSSVLDLNAEEHTIQKPPQVQC